MGIGVGVIAAPIVGETIRGWPRVLAIPAGRSVVIGGQNRTVAVDGDDVGGEARIPIGFGDDVPGVCRRAGVGEAGVVVDDLVQRQAKGFPRQTQSRIVVPCGRIGGEWQRQCQGEQQHNRDENVIPRVGHGELPSLPPSVGRMADTVSRKVDHQHSPGGGPLPDGRTSASNSTIPSGPHVASAF